MSNVLVAIKKLRDSMSVCPDNILGPIVRAYTELFLPTLAAVLNRSVRSCTFPELWKTCNVAPAYKYGKKSVTSNHRPVPLLSVVSMVFDTVMHLYVSYFT